MASDYYKNLATTEELRSHEKFISFINYLQLLILQLYGYDNR